MNIRIDLPWAPCLSPNVRMHRMKRYRLTAKVREDTGWLGKKAKVSRAVPPVAVQLHYRPAKANYPDAGNLTLDSKACLDGLIDAGMAPDDAAAYVQEGMPIVHEVEKGKPAALWIEIEWSKV